MLLPCYWKDKNVPLFTDGSPLEHPVLGTEWCKPSLQAPFALKVCLLFPCGITWPMAMAVQLPPILLAAFWKCLGPDCDFCSGFARSCCGKVKIAFISTYSCLAQHYNPNERKVSKFGSGSIPSHFLLYLSGHTDRSKRIIKWWFIGK